MKVKDLSKALASLDPELEVLGYLEDERLAPEGHFFLVFNVRDCSATQCAMTRLDDGTPSLVLGAKAGDRRHALIELEWEKA